MARGVTAEKVAAPAGSARAAVASGVVARVVGAVAEAARAAAETEPAAIAAAAA